MGLLLLCMPDWVLADPALHIRGAERVEILTGGGRLVTLASGRTVRMRTHGEGFVVEYTGERRLERWTRTATGYTISSDGGAVRRVYDRDIAGWSLLRDGAGFRILRVQR